MPLQEQTTDLSYILSDLGGRIRALEGKQTLFGERLLVVNKNMIEEYKKLINQVRSTEEEIREIKKDIFELKEFIKKIARDMQKFAKKESLKVLEKYINIWSPMNFVTEEEVKKLIGQRKNV